MSLKIHIEDDLPGRHIIYYTLQLIAVNKGIEFSYTSSASDADLIIDFVIVIKESVNHSIYSDSKTRNDKLLWNIPKRRRYSTPGSSGNITEKEYSIREDKSEEGTLIILIKDRKTDQLVWQGQCSEAFLPEEDFSTELTPAVKKILKHFPVSIKSKGKN